MTVPREIDWERYVAANEELERVLYEEPGGMTSLFQRIAEGCRLKTEEQDRILDAMKELICANFNMSEWPYGFTKDPRGE
jgi:hypothetical protein